MGEEADGGPYSLYGRNIIASNGLAICRWNQIEAHREINSPAAALGTPLCDASAPGRACVSRRSGRAASEHLAHRP